MVGGYKMWVDSIDEMLDTAGLPYDKSKRCDNGGERIVFRLFIDEEQELMLKLLFPNGWFIEASA